MNPSSELRLKALAGAMALAFAADASATLITVTSNADSGVGTLRSALQFVQTESACGCVGAPYTINFAFTGLTTIPVNTSLPSSTCRTIIDGYDQTPTPATGATLNTVADIRNGTNAQPKIVLNGSGMTGGVGLTIAGANSVVQGLVFRSFPQAALAIQAPSAFVAGNFFGANETATACAASANMVGVSIGFSASGALVGGNSGNPADRNVFGCMSRGIDVQGSDAGIFNNLIGTGAGGATLPNGIGVAVLTSGFSPGVSVGSTVAGLGNVIARNTGAGVAVGSNRNSVYVEGNDIFLNGGLGIDLGNNGPTPNAVNLTPNAAQPNGAQNFPLVTFVRYDAANTQVSWSISGFANSTVFADFFSNPPGFGLDQGARWIGSASGNTDPLGSFSGASFFPGILASPTMTATGSAGTSEFSPPASLDVSPKNLVFTGTVGSTSAPQAVTYTNISGGPITIGPPITVGDFAATSTCNGITPVPAGGTCTASVTFTPLFLGSSFDYLDMPTSGTGGGRGIALQGNAIPVPILAVSPVGPVNFGSQVVGASTAPVTFTLTNSGNGVLDVLGVTKSGPFAGSFQIGTDGCTGRSLGMLVGQVTRAPGPPMANAGLPVASCDVTVFMQPQAAGALAATLAIQSTATNPLVQVALAGTGTPVVTPIGTATLANPGPIDFGSQQIGTQSPTRVITLANTGAGPFTVSSARAGRDGFVTVSDGCTGVPVASGGSCSIVLAFAPTLEGFYRTTFQLLSNASNPQVLVELRGTGTPLPVGLLSVSNGLVSFGTQPVGVATNPQAVQVTNAGTLPVTVSAVRVTGDFAQTNDCRALDPGQGCRVFVTFTPTAIGDRSGSLVVESDASNRLVVSLQGAGSPAPVPAIELTPSAISFGTALQGAGAAGTPVTLRNSGGANLSIAGIFTVGDFAQTNNCPVNIPPGASCTVTVSFVPQITGSRQGKLVIESNAPAGNREAPLSGTGCALPSRAGSRLARPNCG